MANKRNKRRSSRARSCPDSLVNQLEGLNLERDSAEEVYNGPDWGMYEQIDREMEAVEIAEDDFEEESKKEESKEEEERDAHVCLVSEACLS
jgi:hypothetical protein